MDFPFSKSARSHQRKLACRKASCDALTLQSLFSSEYKFHGCPQYIFSLRSCNDGLSHWWLWIDLALRCSDVVDLVANDQYSRNQMPEYCRDKPFQWMKWPDTAEIHGICSTDYNIELDIIAYSIRYRFCRRCQCDTYSCTRSAEIIQGLIFDVARTPRMRTAVLHMFTVFQGVSFSI